LRGSPSTVAFSTSNSAMAFASTVRIYWFEADGLALGKQVGA
jgi:hypothetical protein